MTLKRRVERRLAATEAALDEALGDESREAPEGYIYDLTREAQLLRVLLYGSPERRRS